VGTASVKSLANFGLFLDVVAEVNLCSVSFVPLCFGDPLSGHFVSTSFSPPGHVFLMFTVVDFFFALRSGLS